MTREIKANLIFLIVLAVLVAPGFYILMQKRLHGPSKPIFMGDAMKTSAAYNQPPPVPPNLPRVEPLVVRAWVTSLLQADADTSAILLRTSNDPAAGPVMGDRYVTQAIGIDRQKEFEIVRVLIWDAQALTLETVHLTTESDQNIEISGLRVIDVPKEVRHALQDAGFIDPPEKVTMLQCRFTFNPSHPMQKLKIDLPAKKTESLLLPEVVQ